MQLSLQFLNLRTVTVVASSRVTAGFQPLLQSYSLELKLTTAETSPSLKILMCVGRVAIINPIFAATWCALILT